MPDTRLIRRVRFRATHHYGRSDAPADENRRRFGEQSEPHEHEWCVEVHVAGPVDPDTGWLMDLRDLDGTLDRLMRGWDGGDLNALVPPVARGAIQPSTEALAGWLYEELHGRVAKPARLVEVRVFESPDLGACFPA